MKLSTKISSQQNKRRFIKKMLTGSLASIALPTLASANSSIAKSQQDFNQLKSLYEASDERYWEMVKKQYTIPANLIMLNAANLCPSPYFVTEKVTSLQQSLEKNVSFQYRAVFDTEREKALKALAEFVVADVEEVGITRNTTESNNTIVNGLPLKKGDEIILWDQNHPTNSTAWAERAKRDGFVIKTVSVPESPESIEDLIAPFEAAITGKTKLISFSHISNTSGIALPAKKICALAKSKGILSMVDGAQSFGVMNVDLKDIDCDFYSGSTHKWLMGPLENGILYIKKDHIDQLWPSIVGAGWKSGSTTVDEKFCVVGQRNNTTESAIPAIIDFHMSIGKQQIEDRVKAIHTYLKKQIQTKVPTAKFITPLQPELSAGVTIINLPDKDNKEIFSKLYETHGIACAPTGGLRLSAHIYNTMADIDKVTDALSAVI